MLEQDKIIKTSLRVPDSSHIAITLTSAKMGSSTETITIPTSGLTTEGRDQTSSTPIRAKGHSGPDASKFSPIESFAQEAKDNAKLVSEYFRDKDLPHPSFAFNAPPNAFESAPDDVLAARTRLTEAALRLLQLAQGPQEYIPNLAVNVSH